MTTPEEYRFWRTVDVVEHALRSARQKREQARQQRREREQSKREELKREIEAMRWQA